jgi:hypothetical protein
MDIVVVFVSGKELPDYKAYQRRWRGGWLLLSCVLDAMLKNGYLHFLKTIAK